MNKSCRWFPCALIAALGLTTPAGAQEWPQWRGPEWTGRADPALVPDRGWPAALETAWSVEVGTGHASPLLAGERIYLHTRLDDRETVSALALEDGGVIWRQSYDAPYTVNPAASGHGKGPKSTPVLAGGRLFTLGISGVLSAWSAADGSSLWRHDFAGRFTETSPAFGTAMSPIVEGDRLIAHVGGAAGNALAAFDAATGRQFWAWTDDGPAYASPVIGDLAGVRTVVTQTQQRVVGLELDTGRLLWSRPFTTPWIQNSVTPILSGDLVIISGLGQGITALHPARDSDGGWSVDSVWTTKEASLYMSSPVPVGDRLCGFSHLEKGQFFCLQPDQGAVIWRGPGRSGENAALLAADRWVLALTDDARLTVFPGDSDSFGPVATWEVADSPTWAHPVLLADGVLVKDKTRLIRLRYPRPETPRP